MSVFDPRPYFSAVPEVERFESLMKRLFVLLSEANAVTNLTRITSEEGFWVKHVIDSLLVAEAFPEGLTAGKKWFDLGCGGGFPSLVLVAAFSQIHVTAMDSIGKKTRFVAEAGNALGLSNLNVMTGRGREVCHKPPLAGAYDVLTARAVAEPSEILKEAAAVLKRNGSVVLYQTPEQIASESVQLLISKPPAPFRFRVSEEQILPLDMGTRRFLIASKA